MTDNSKGLLYAGFTALLWGFLAIALKVSLYDLNPVSVVWFRFSVAFTLLLIIMGFSGRMRKKIIQRPPWQVFVAAAFLGLNYLGFITGISKTSPSNAQVFIQIGPVSLAFAGLIIFREKLSWKHAVGFFLLAGGFWLFYSEQSDVAGTRTSGYTSGIISIMLGGLSWAVFSVIQKFLVKKRDPNFLNLMIYGFCSIMFLPFVEFDRFSSLDTGDWLLLIFLGVNTLLAYGSLALALKYTEANKISVIITLNPVITFIVMAILSEAAVTWIAAEHFTLLSIAGAGIVFTGASIVVMTRRKKKGAGSFSNEKNPA